MANLSLVFDLIGKDRASKPMRDVADAASKTGRSVEKAGKSGSIFGSTFAKGIGLASGAFAAAGFGQMFGGFITDARESAKIGRLTEAVVRSTGGAAKITADQVGQLATAISNKTGADDEAVQSGANLLLTFTKVRNETGKGNDIFNQATQAAVDMSVALGTDTKGAALQLGKALNDPIKGVAALGRAGVSFTAQQKEQIKTLVESGRTLDAQKIILGEMKTQFGGAAQAAADPLQRLSVIAGNLGEQIGGFLLPYIEKGAKLFGQFADGLNYNVTVGDSARTMAQTLGLGLRALADSFRYGDVTSDGFVGTMEKVGVVLRSAFTYVKSTVIPTAINMAKFVQRNTDVFIPLAAAVGSMVVAVKLYTLVTKIAAVTTGIFNAVLAANPIGLVVLAAIGLTAAFVVLYKRSETFRGAVDKLWGFLKRFIGFTPLGFLIKNFDTVTTAVGKAWDGAKRFFKAMKDFKIPGWVKELASFAGSIGGGLKSAGNKLNPKNWFGDGPGIGGSPGDQPRGVKAMMAALPAGTRLISGFRPGAITATGNASYHGKGRAVDLPPSMALFNYIKARFGKVSKELIFSPAGGRQVHNGRERTYSGVTRANHFDHVHWAMDQGGIANGIGYMPKLTSRPERVLSPDQTQAFERLVSVLERGGGTGGPAVQIGAVYAHDDRAVAKAIETRWRDAVTLVGMA